VFSIGNVVNDKKEKKVYGNYSEIEYLKWKRKGKIKRKNVLEIFSFL